MNCSCNGNTCPNGLIELEDKTVITKCMMLPVTRKEEEKYQTRLVLIKKNHNERCPFCGSLMDDGRSSLHGKIWFCNSCLDIYAERPQPKKRW